VTRQATPRQALTLVAVVFLLGVAVGLALGRAL
jgi:hypothetical protein